MDWKDALAKLNDSGAIPQVDDEPAAEAAPAKPAVQKEPLNVLIDRKGRKGKTATIIEGFLCDDSEVEDIAKKLKQKIGTGGSSRDGEILLQGEWKERAATLLRELGFKVKVH